MISRILRLRNWGWLSLTLTLGAIVGCSGKGCSEGSEQAASMRLSSETVSAQSKEAPGSTSKQLVDLKQALKGDSDESVYSALQDLYKLADPSTIEAIREVRDKWSKKDHHDSLHVAELASIVLEKIEAQILLKTHVPEEAEPTARIEAYLKLAREHGQNYELMNEVRAAIHKHDDEQIIPFLIADKRQSSKDRLQAFGDRASKQVIQAASSGADPHARLSAIANVGLMKLKDGIDPLIQLVAKSGAANGPEAEVRSMAVWALGRYDVSALPRIEAALADSSGTTREGLLAAIGEIGGSEALRVLRTARPNAESDSTLLTTIDYYIDRIERGVKDDDDE